MAHPYHHSLSSVKRWGGRVEDYLPIHDWFDASKAFIPDFRHRALRHHAEGIFECEQVFGTTITNSDGKVVPVRYIGEQHVKEDLGRIPTLQDWFSNIRFQKWMATGVDKSISRLEAESGEGETEEGQVADRGPATAATGIVSSDPGAVCRQGGDEE